MTFELYRFQNIITCVTLIICDITFYLCLHILPQHKCNDRRDFASIGKHQLPEAGLKIFVKSIVTNSHLFSVKCYDSYSNNIFSFVPVHLEECLLRLLLCLYRRLHLGHSWTNLPFPSSSLYDVSWLRTRSFLRRRSNRLESGPLQWRRNFKTTLHLVTIWSINHRLKKHLIR